VPENAMPEMRRPHLERRHRDRIRAPRSDWQGCYATG
jgi:hypothetical protein